MWGCECMCNFKVSCRHHGTLVSHPCMSIIQDVSPGNKGPRNTHNNHNTIITPKTIAIPYYLISSLYSYFFNYIQTVFLQLFFPQIRIQMKVLILHFYWVMCLQFLLIQEKSFDLLIVFIFCLTTLTFWRDEASCLADVPHSLWTDWFLMMLFISLSPEFSVTSS